MENKIISSQMKKEVIILSLLTQSSGKLQHIECDNHHVIE